MQQIEQGEASASEQLLPLVYDELRKLAAAKLANEKPGQTRQATALVHETYLRLIGGELDKDWDSPPRAHRRNEQPRRLQRIRRTHGRIE